VIALVHALDFLLMEDAGDCGFVPVKDTSTTRHNRFDKSRTTPPHSHGICTFRVADWVRRAVA
jgi:hypothetical protein